MTPPALPATIAVDLTPVLPGGDNGGAKRFALELVRRIAADEPQTRFVLLTQSASHDELACLERPNVERRLVVGERASASRASFFGLAARAYRPLPQPLKQVAAGAGFWLHSRLKRSGGAGVLRGIGAQLLFCPFTAPTYRERGVATVCTVYDLQFRAYPQFFAVEDRVQRERAFGLACRHATALVAISEFSRRSAMEAGAVADRIHTVHLRLASVDPGPAADALERLGLAPQGYFLYPANFWKHKNHEMLLTAFGLARARGLPHMLKLVCTGADAGRRGELAGAAQALGLGAQVLFAGFVTEAELQALLAGARGLVFPSLYEGFGLPVLDAMSRGVPVACSDAAALPEIAGGAALLFDARIPERIAAAMLALASDEAMRERLVEAGRKRAHDFADGARMSREYREVFRGAMSALAA